MELHVTGAEEIQIRSALELIGIAAHQTIHILTAPVLLAWTAPRDPHAARLWEAMVASIGAVATGAWVFSRVPGGDLAGVYLLLPLVAWVAVRIGTRAATLVTVLIELVAVACTAAGQGPFALPATSIAQQILALQLFLATLTSFMLVLAAAISQEVRTRAAAEEAVRSATVLSHALAEALVHRTAMPATTRAWPATPRRPCGSATNSCRSPATS